MEEEVDMVEADEAEEVDAAVAVAAELAVVDTMEEEVVAVEIITTTVPVWHRFMVILPQKPNCTLLKHSEISLMIKGRQFMT